MLTPLCFSVDGILGGDAEVFLKRLGDGLAMKWGKSYSEVMGWSRARPSFAILRASFLASKGHIKDGGDWDWRMMQALVRQGRNTAIVVLPFPVPCIVLFLSCRSMLIS